ncbi:MAG: membrane protein insertion efficiency factor YidD [Acidimicrobiales bacterium]
MSPVARALRWCIRLYQQLREGRPSPCRYQPTCSSYALEAVEVHGAGRGSWLAVRRLCRCHPWGGHGWDPVPLPEPASDPGSDNLRDRTVI